MANFEKIEGKRKGSFNLVHEGFIYTRLRCHMKVPFTQKNRAEPNLNLGGEIQKYGIRPENSPLLASLEFQK